MTFDPPHVAAVVAPIVAGPSNSVYPQRAHTAAVHVVVVLHAYHAAIVELGCSDPEMSAMVQVPSVNYNIGPLGSDCPGGLLQLLSLLLLGSEHN